MSVQEPRMALIAGVWLLAATAAHAAPEAAPASGGLEEVIVTAQKRSESEQTVPMSITTFSAQALEAKAINDFFDYATKVPNLAFAPTGDGVGTARTVSIRGISGNDVTGFYIDDIPLPDSVDPRVLDVDHIEVLRGPQGTLYGARSMGGTVRVITKEPELSQFSATVHGGMSDTDRTDQPNYTGDAIVNIPLIQDRVALRVTGFYDYEAGYFKRTWCTDPATAGVTCFPLSTTGRSGTSNVAAIDTYGGSASLTIKATDAITLTPRVMVQRTGYNGFPLGDFNSVPNNGIGFPAPSGPYTLPQPLVTNNFTQARFFNIPEGGTDWWDLYSLALHWKTGLGEFISSTAYFDRKVNETEDESEFIWAAITSGRMRQSGAPVLQSASPGPDPGNQGLPAFRRGSAFRLAAVRSGAVRGRRVLLRLPRPRAVRLAVPARAGAGVGRRDDRRAAQQPRRYPEPRFRPGLPYRRAGARGVRRGDLGHQHGMANEGRTALVPSEDDLRGVRGGTGGGRRQDLEPECDRQRERRQPEVRAGLPRRPRQDGVRTGVQRLSARRCGTDRAAGHTEYAQ